MADAGRVIAGSARGIRLRAPGGATRPLGDRVKQTLFAILEPELAGARVVDLFAGSGAAGIEALSRGAAAAWFVEIDPIAVRTIEENLARTGLAGPRATVVHDDGLRWLAGAAHAIRPVDLAIVDPPYARSDLLLAVLERLGGPDEDPVLAAGGTAVAKHFWRSGPPPGIGLLASERTRRFGETALTFYRRRAAESEGA
jgi:16S rRNA (guanine966-N2)-methyltransferase